MKVEFFAAEFYKVYWRGGEGGCGDDNLKRLSVFRSFYEKNRVTPSVTATGDTNTSAAIELLCECSATQAMCYETDCKL